MAEKVKKKCHNHGLEKLKCAILVGSQLVVTSINLHLMLKKKKKNRRKRVAGEREKRSLFTYKSKSCQKVSQKIIRRTSRMATKGYSRQTTHSVRITENAAQVMEQSDWLILVSGQAVN